MLLQYYPELQGPNIRKGVCRDQNFQKSNGIAKCGSPNPAVAPPSPSSFFPPQPLLIEVALLGPSLLSSYLPPLLSLVTRTSISSHIPVFDNSNDFVSQSKLSLVEMSVLAHLYGSIVFTYGRTPIFGLVDWQLGVWYGTMLLGWFAGAVLEIYRASSYESFARSQFQKGER